MRKILALILAMTLALSCMSIATSAYGAGETFTITDPAPEAEAPTETVNTIIDDNFDAEDATIGGWYHHWGNSNNDIVDGALFTNRGESNIMYSTGHDIGAMTAGNTYAVTLKLMVPDEEGACADGKVTATVFFKTDGLDGDVLARKNVELDVNTWSDEVKLTFKAKADVAKAVLSINFDGEGWGNFNPAGLYVDDVLLTETVPAPEHPEEPVEGKYTGWFVTGPETHAMRIGRAIITLPHEYNANGDCIYCRHHTDLTEEDVEIEVAYESETEETEDDVVVEDENPTTGVALALVPMAVAAVAVISKRR